jgi:hypothetical protein
MAEMSLEEAQLFRMLVSFFGKDRVLWSMSLRAVCGGDIPEHVRATSSDKVSWVEHDKCLFTVVDDDDNPKMVMEFSPDYSDYIEIDQLERQKHLPPILGACGVQYITISPQELVEILDPHSSLDFFSFLKDKFGIDDTTEDAVKD